MPRIIVSNTTPIITLVGVGKFELLQQLYGEVIVPESVYQEIEAGKYKSFYADLKQFSWIDIRPVDNQEALEALCDILDKGEAAAIVLAQELQADLVLLDERMARRYAKEQGLPHTGSFGILLKAKQQGFIKEVKPYLETAQKNGIRLSKQLIRVILKEANED